MDKEQDEKMRLECVKHASNVFAAQRGYRDEALSPLELAKWFYDWIMERESDSHEEKRQE